MYRDRNILELISFLFIYKLCTIPSFVRNVDKIYNGAVRFFGMINFNIIKILFIILE
jgi:hypothetical protein